VPFDELLCSSARLSILSALIAGEAHPFTDLKQWTELADGNLHVQTRKLAEAGYLEILKTRRAGRSLTLFRITERGVTALKLHVRKLESILDREEGEIRPRKAGGKPDDSQVWS